METQDVVARCAIGEFVLQPSTRRFIDMRLDNDDLNLVGCVHGRRVEWFRRRTGGHRIPVLSTWEQPRSDGAARRGRCFSAPATWYWLQIQSLLSQQAAYVSRLRYRRALATLKRLVAHQLTAADDNRASGRLRGGHAWARPRKSVSRGSGASRRLG
ncbi:hypothetical protein [Streptomyces sp. SID13031]|uniref:hypothetical protein n=1 Tax=Streptomyces sp. SID13031 TaxID=2706046 RepID=UPI0013CB3130|nr:hypothetical protein [Streptomyces sp. SID13031]NEA31236.1 hypothetical protein [Streptomyces sp. SID13031]